MSFPLKNSITFLYILTPLLKDALKSFLTPFEAKTDSARKSRLRFLKDISSHGHVIWGRYRLFQDRRSSVIFLANLKVLTVN